MFITTHKKYSSLGEHWIDCMRNVLLSGESICDGNVHLKEITNYYATLMSITENDSIILRHADQERISLMQRKYASCSILPEYKISYGKLLYDNNSINQIEWVIKRLRNKPETKSATITMHPPGNDELSCLSMLDFKYRSGALSMNIIYRSQNVYASQPGNLISLRKLQEYIADSLNINVGTVELVVLSAHIYSCDLDNVKQILASYDEYEVENGD